VVLEDNIITIDDEAVATFANALVNNRSLMILELDGIPLSTQGQLAFSNLLCDTSSINSTFLSNHNLQYLGQDYLRRVTPLKPLLDLNRRKNKEEVAMIKILQHHNDFDMTPFFEWEFKVLPLMIDWFERASDISIPRNNWNEVSGLPGVRIRKPSDMPEGFDPNIGPRKLSSIYQFVRGMPLLYVETRLRKELEDVKAAQTQMEQAMLLLEKRKRNIMDRLGRQQ